MAFDYAILMLLIYIYIIITEVLKDLLICMAIAYIYISHTIHYNIYYTSEN